MSNRQTWEALRRELFVDNKGRAEVKWVDRESVPVRSGCYVLKLTKRLGKVGENGPFLYDSLEASVPMLRGESLLSYIRQIMTVPFVDRSRRRRQAEQLVLFQ
jgi:hypothetical protein